jgi:two-component system, chemotaxis family, chemotaxis protein CheY
MTGSQDIDILIVDDHDAMRTIVGTLLRGFGFYGIREAESAKTALRMLEELSADLVIVDLKMMGMDGIDFTRRLRAEPDRRAYVPVLMMTGHATRDQVVAARDAGVNEFIVKPVTGRMLGDRLHRIIEEERPFVRAAGYVGPCRRRRTPKDYAGPFRRAADAPRVAAAD